MNGQSPRTCLPVNSKIPTVSSPHEYRYVRLATRVCVCQPVLPSNLLPPPPPLSLLSAQEAATTCPGSTPTHSRRSHRSPSTTSPRRPTYAAGLAVSRAPACTHLKGGAPGPEVRCCYGSDSMSLVYYSSCAVLSQ